MFVRVIQAAALAIICSLTFIFFVFHHVNTCIRNYLYSLLVRDFTCSQFGVIINIITNAVINIILHAFHVHMYVFC